MNKRRRILITLIVGCVTLLGLSIWAITFLNTNYAIEATKPLEQALINKGGIRYYENGDAGHGPDNRSPWRQVFYEMPLDQSEAVKLANQIASQNGYKLIQASPQNRGPLGVADAFIDKWYYDYSSKDASFPGLQAGKVRLAFIVDGPGSTYNSGRNIPKDHSIVGIDLSLPSYK